MSRLRATEIFNDTGLKLIAIETVDVSRGKTGPVCRLYATIAPVALVVLHRQRVYAVDMASKPVDLEQLKSDVPGLDALIASIDPAIYD